MVNGLLGRGLAYAAGAPARGALLAEGRCYTEIYTIVFNNIFIKLLSIQRSFVPDLGKDTNIYSETQKNNKPYSTQTNNTLGTT